MTVVSKTKNQHALVAVSSSEKILGAVPNAGVYSKALTFLRLWSKARRCSNANYGFLPGCALSIMLAVVCIESGNSEVGPVQIISNFFQRFSRVDWAAEVISIDLKNRDNIKKDLLNVYDPDSGKLFCS
jgi:poly(A) polymerase Pap1